MSPLQMLESDLKEFLELVDGGFPEAGAKQFSFYSRVTSVLQAFADDSIVVDNAGILQVTHDIDIQLLSGAITQLYKFMTPAGDFGMTEAQLLKSLELKKSGVRYNRAAWAACIAVGVLVAKQGKAGYYTIMGTR